MKIDTTMSSVLGLSTITAEKVSPSPFGLSSISLTPVSFILTRKSAGLAKEIMRYHQNIARSENLPIWLEATTPSSRHLYLSLGFQEIEEIILGKGKVAPDSSIQPGGPGVSLWAMVWWPESSEHAPKS